MRTALPHGAARLAVGLYRVSTAEQGHSAAAAKRAAYQLALEVERLRAESVTGQAAIARALTERGGADAKGERAWTHTIVAWVLARAAA